MIIKTIDEISIQCENVVEANKLRMKNIQNNIKDLAAIEITFFSLEKAILRRDIESINNIISKRLFFEKVCTDFECELINSYEKQINKKYFMDELRKSYVMRGAKGLQFAWMPIILRKG